jgi:hypothetical protein
MNYGIASITKDHFVSLVIVIAKADVTLSSVVVVVIIDPYTAINETIIVNRTYLF